MTEIALDGAPAEVRPPAPRQYGAVNWIGLQTLYQREIRRFWKVGMQTVAAPVVTTLLYMMVFVVAMVAFVGVLDYGFTKFVFELFG